MNAEYAKAKRIFKSLQNRLHDGTSISPSVSEKHLEVVKKAVRDQFLKEKSAAGVPAVKPQRNKSPKVPSLKAGAKAGKKQPGVQETGIIIAGDVPTDRTEFIQSMVSKIKPEGSPQVKPEFKRRAHRRRKQTKHSKA